LGVTKVTIPFRLGKKGVEGSRVTKVGTDLLLGLKD